MKQTISYDDEEIMAIKSECAEAIADFGMQFHIIQELYDALGLYYPEESNTNFRDSWFHYRKLYTQKDIITVLNEKYGLEEHLLRAAKDAQIYFLQQLTGWLEVWYRLPNMNQIIIRLRQPFLCHQLLFIKLLPRSQPSSCQDRNNFFLKKICNTMNYRITHKNGAKKELLFSQKPFHINYLLFYYFLKNLPIQQIILFSYTFKNQFLGSHIKFYRLYSLIRIIT